MIKDRELLVLCDLTNLKIEYMDNIDKDNNGNVKLNGNGEPKFHSLYSLVDSLEDNTEFMENYYGSWDKVKKDAKALFETYYCSETSS